MSERKPRSDSKLDNMPESRVLELRDMMLRGASHQNCLDWLAVECGISVSSSALTAFYKRHCAPVIREKRQFSAIKAEALGKAMEEDPVSWDEKIVERTKQLTFEFLAADQEAIDPKAVKDLLEALTKANKQALERQKFLAATKTKIEAGLDALLVEIQGNPRAMQLFNELKEVVAKA